MRESKGEGEKMAGREGSGRDLGTCSLFVLCVQKNATG